MESGLYCELTDKTLHDGYIEYTLLYDMIANRITIDEVRAENGSLSLNVLYSIMSSGFPSVEWITAG